MNHIYNHIRDPHDPRDRKLTLVGPPQQLPASVDLRNSFMPPVYDQGSLGSCSANSIGGIFQYGLRQQGLPDFMPSRLFLYYNERILEGTADQDAGACLRDGMKSISQRGICKETTWPYDISKFAVMPSGESYIEAKHHLATAYLSVNQDLNSIKAALAAGNPISFGFQVYDSFESDTVAATGNMPMPDQSVEKNLGGHAVVCCGYKDDGRWIIRNSWSNTWGDGGYFYMPQAFLLDSWFCSDFWIIKMVE